MALKAPKLPLSAQTDPGGESNEKEDQLRKHQNATILSKTVHWIESHEMPQCLLKRQRKSTGEKLFIVTGLRQVFYGTLPAAEVVRIAGIRPPRYLCYMISGSGCDIIQFVLYILFYQQLKDASVCWALSFGSSILFRHTTHRYLVFGDYVGGYWRSLGRMYAGYSIIIVLSTIFNFVVMRYVDIPHILAWVLTILWTGIVNYFILKKLWSFGGSKKEGNASCRSLPMGDTLNTKECPKHLSTKTDKPTRSV